MIAKKIPKMVENGCCVGGHHEQSDEGISGGVVVVTVTHELVLLCTKHLGPHMPTPGPQQPIPGEHELWH